MFRVPEYVLARTVDDEVILFDARRGGYLGLNPTGAAVWNVIASGRPGVDAVEELVSLFDVDWATAENDVAALLHDLEARDLISPLVS